MRLLELRAYAEFEKKARNSVQMSQHMPNIHEHALFYLLVLLPRKLRMTARVVVNTKVNWTFTFCYLLCR